ncbi:MULTISPECIES: outer membrane protein assembly factor BamA [unclassified Ruegeria]|uniref:outer membrane protein assembly factor BamA n=1 Tax=unclassified Ruegeria TaxID=2625375 RepID=UPI001488A434|nr:MULTISPECIES: outer membrane protein assembly factor BamA [unclassified Ruegeria]NOD63271.1 outer membrane protein assembly factor BamA [Ruegeria sp. HKCCD6109]NOD75477.1 outer membrane protein assembly factor BamA [Ruegeria sp. HKCCD4332]NOD87459.1 outer membrane protein assembly factor BamA [Ruegeria sp. HKCCD4318]NOD91557.1 outer membrane protein assembly factor BamA [Ruegeria sp. HKCCD4884]NOE13014.1 outer membrane protein assembly factor BamA [Ruegeria sp. HKCCD4318-2]
MTDRRDAGTSCGGQMPTNNILWQALTVLFLFVAACLVAFPNAAQAQNFTINSFQVEGNRRIETGTIIARTGIEPGQTVSAGQINDAYQRLLDSGVFETVELTPRGTTLVIEVQEYPTINQISIEGNARVKDDVLLDAIESEPRRVFTPQAAEADADLIAEIYSAQGRVAATVIPRIIRRSDNRVDLVFEVSEGTTIEVERVSFVGNRAFSDRRLRRVLETKQATFLRTFFRNDTFIGDRIEFDKQVIRDFYLSRGYVDFRVNSANVEFTRERDAFFLVMNVTEGQKFSFGKITTVSEIPGVNAAEYQDALKIKPGVTYTPSLIENSIARQERLGVKQGVDFLRVEPRITRNDRDLTLDVEFVLTKGPRIFVERIDIEGNTTTLDRVIRRQFDTVEGDPFNPREIRQAAERINALGFFATADVEPREGSSPSQVILDVDVEEQPTGSLSLGGSYSVTDGFGIAIGLNESNFLGRGQNLGLTISTAQDSEQYAISFTEPYLLGRKLRFDLGLGLSGTNSGFASYDTSSLFFTPQLTYAIGELSSLRLRYGWDRSEMTQQDNETNGAVISSEIAQGKRTSSSLGVSYVYDSRLGGLDPNSGVLFEVGVDAAGLGGDNKYFKTTARGIAQTRVWNEEVVLRATMELGALHWRGNDFSRTVDRFVLGPNTFRGFEPAGIGPRDLSNGQDDAIGGNYYWVARFETDFPLGLPEELGLRGGLFYDVGNLYNIDDVNTAGATIVGASGSIRHVIGISVLWDTPFGPLQFNFSQPLKKESFDKEQNFDFTIQARF